MKTIKEINEKIKNGKVNVVTAEEMTRLVREIGPEKAAERVDVVTTGTFGAMCSSGVWLNFGHADPPIKMSRVWLNGVEAYTGVAAVDAFLGATQPSKEKGIRYGGAHVIQDLVERRPVILRAISRGTDCYPRKRVVSEITIEDLNQAVMCNPRNAYQKYAAATNSTGRIIYTYMGKLLPRFGNVTYSGAGELSPLINDPNFETIGIGTRIFLAGAQGYIIGNGTQHNPEAQFGTLMVMGNLKEMSGKFLRAATFTGYGCTLYIGIGIPIPVLNVGIARKTAISDEEIFTEVVDYGIPSRERPVLRRINYAELKSGVVELNGKLVRTSSVSSIYMARKVALTLKEWIESGEFLLTEPVERLSDRASYRSMVQKWPELRESIKEEEKLVTFPGYVYKDDEKCVHCGLCVSVCPAGVFTFKDDGRVAADADSCAECDLCKDICPVGAIYVRDSHGTE